MDTAATAKTSRLVILSAAFFGAWKPPAAPAADPPAADTPTAARPTWTKLQPANGNPISEKVPVTFCVFFRPGESAGQRPITVVADGHPVPAQVDVIRTFDDGSVKHVVVSMVSPGPARPVRYPRGFSGEQGLQDRRRAVGRLHRLLREHRPGGAIRAMPFRISPIVITEMTPPWGISSACSQAATAGSQRVPFRNSETMLVSSKYRITRPDQRLGSLLRSWKNPRPFRRRASSSSRLRRSSRTVPGRPPAGHREESPCARLRRYGGARQRVPSIWRQSSVRHFAKATQPLACTSSFSLALDEF
jgi:hypothetical protein